MKIFVISLISETGRQENIKRQFTDARLDFEFFWGVDGRKGPHDLFKKYDEELRMKIKGEPLLPGQLGCFASHYLLWLKCLQENEPFLVIEDDAQIDFDKLKEFIRFSEILDSKYECVRLFKNKSRVRSAFPIEAVGGFTLCKFFKGHMSTTGYYLTPSAARKFLSASQKWTLPVDISMDQFWRNKVECYGVEPPCLTNDENFDSSMQYVPKAKKNSRSTKVRVRREFYLLINNIQRFFWNFLFVAKSTKPFERLRF